MIMQTFKETYTNANHSINPSDELVENTRLKMHNSSTKSNENIIYTNKTFRLASVIVCSFLILAGIAVLVIIISNQNAGSLPFNKIDYVASGAPRADSGISGALITAEDTTKYLGYFLTDCLPESLSAFGAGYGGLYDTDNRLLGLSVCLVQDNPENPQGKGFFCEIVDTSTSSGVLTIDYTYSPTTMETGDILGITVLALERLQYTFTNEATGYKREEPAVYIAEFTAGTNYYYIEARQGITKSEFVEFVTNLIESVNTK